MKKTALLMMVLAAAAAGAEDSPLVKAAKETAARRKTATAVITNDTVGRSTKTLSTSTGGAQVPDYRAATTPASTPAPAGGRATQIVVPVRAPLPSDPRLPQPSQNAVSSSAPGMPQNAGYGATTPRTVQSTAYAPPQSPTTSPAAPRTVANSSSAPAPSQNAGQSRDRRP